jgi:hypothetical protein
MSDQELIRLAAKAAEMPGRWHEVDDGWFVPGNINSWASLIRWDPLVRDIDAFRLMVQLNLFVFHSWTHAEGVPLANVVVDNAEQTITSGEIKGDNPYAATRRAIVRAAAAIGKNQEENHGN